MPLATESMESRLLFVIGPPRSGTTLLMRMLGSHSAIYGRHERAAGGLSDPISVNKHTRPVTESADTWATELAEAPEKLRLMREMIETIEDADLETWGFPRASFLHPVERPTRSGAHYVPKPSFDRFWLQRKALVFLRRHVRNNVLERLVRRPRLLCDVLLRG